MDTTDVSNNAIGAVLKSVINTLHKPLGFVSRTLNKAERYYNTFHRELLSVHHAIRHFQRLIGGVPSTIQTDHHPLLTALTKTGDAWSGRQQCQLSAIAESGGLLTYIPGTENPVADVLPRVTITMYTYELIIKH